MDSDNRHRTPDLDKGQFFTHSSKGKQNITLPILQALIPIEQ